MPKITKNIFPLEWRLTDPLVVPYHGSKVFGTFVCGGGSTMGYKLAGYHHLGGVELIEKYADLYRHNHHPELFYLEDMRLFNQRTDLPDELYQLDLLDGSPPCAAFSMAGAREKIWGKLSDYEGVMQVKDDLVYVYCDTIKKLKPKIFLLENVSGLMKGNARIYLRNIVDTLSVDYEVQAFLLYAASMGIPQMRNRVFIIGRRKELKLPKLELEFDCPQVNFDITKKYWNEGVLFNPQSSVYKKWLSIDGYGQPHEKNFSLIKVSPDKPANTITESATHKNAYGVVHHLYPRNLNREEIRLCSTFPLDYDFLHYDYGVMGRSVLPVMMANISNQIYLQLLAPK